MTETTARVSLGWFSGQQWRKLRESLTAYLFVFPAFLIIGLFGLFPLLFSVYVSLHRWRIIPGNYLGLDHYVRALDSLAYTLGLWLPLLLAVLAIKSLLKTHREAQETGDRPWSWALPAVVTFGGLFQFLRFALLFLPELLDIAEKVKGQQRTQELFLSLLGEAWRLPEVASARLTAVLILIAGFALAYVFSRWVNPGPRSGVYYIRFIGVLLMVAFAVALAQLTFSEIQEAYALALDEGESLILWEEILTVSAGIFALVVVTQIAARMQFAGRTTWLLIIGGVVLALGARLLIDAGQASLLEILLILGGVIALFFSWRAWKAAHATRTTMGMIAWVMAAIAMMLAAWLLITEIPTAIQSGYDKWWQGLLNTVYYVLFTVPAELVLGLFLAVLLFQNIKGKGVFRLIYFLPYVTNPVAAASVFRVIFSSRVSAPVNSLLSIVGAGRLMWLDEPKGIFQMLFPAAAIPTWLSGPSLALVVICLYGIWTYAGYNTVVFLAGLGSIPTPLYEAAAIDGANRWQQFRNITLPLLSPTTYFLTLVAVIGTFKAFNHIWVLRSGAALGTTDTASVIIFNEFNRNTRYGYASALALVLMGLILVLTLINSRIAEEKVFYG